MPNDTRTRTNRRALPDAYPRNNSGPGPYKSKPPNLYIPRNATTNSDVYAFCYPAIVVDRRTGIDYRQVIYPGFRINHYAWHNSDSAT